MRRSWWGGFGVASAVLAILVCSFLLRVWGSGFGLPAYTRYHPDEHALVERAAAILWTGDWNLHRFNYPPFYAYFQAATYGLYFLWGAAQGLWSQVFPFTIPQYYQWGRVLTAVFGTLTVLVVYLAGRELRGRRAGALAAALLGGNYLHIIHSHYATFDVMVAFLVALTLLFSVLIQSRGDAKWYLLAGLAAGFSGATKYNGAVAIIMPLLAHVLATSWGEWGWLNGRLFLTLGGFLAGFFGGNPFALGNLPDFLNGLALVLHHYGTEQPGFEGTGNWRWYSGVLLSSADAPAVLAGVLGLAGLLWKDWRKGILLAAFPILYFLMVSRFVVRFERNLVPLLPFLALGGGWFLDVGAKWLARKLNQGKGVGYALAGMGLCVLLVLPLLAAVLLDTRLVQTDHRQEAGQWVENNVEHGSKIAIEHYSIPFDYDIYEVEDVIRAGNHDLDWYRREEFDLLIISDGVWELLRGQPTIYADEVAVYEELVSGSSLASEFWRDPPPLVVAGYPTVGVYHFAPVRIYRLSE